MTKPTTRSKGRQRAGTYTGRKAALASEYSAASVAERAAMRAKKQEEKARKNQRELPLTMVTKKTQKKRKTASTTNARARKKPESFGASNDPATFEEEEELTDAAAAVVVKQEVLQATKRAGNYTPDEDKALCRAYLNLTENSIVGVHQSGGVFWDYVKQKFDYLMVEMEGDDCILVRTVALKNCYTKKLQPTLLRFHAHYLHVKAHEESGTNEEDMLDKAEKLFLSAE